MSHSTSHPDQGRMLVKASEAAQMLSISERTLWTLTKHGELQVIWIGNAKRYSIEVLRNFIAGKRGGHGQSCA